MAGLFDTPTTPTLRRLLDEVAAGAILIPEFQRPFVWNDQQRLDLLDSVARGLPIGGIMVWRTREHRLKCYDHLGPFRLPAPVEKGPWTYLIDGHQRLTTLFAALTPLEGAVDIDPDVRWPVKIDLREDPPQFVLPGRGQPAPYVVPVSTVATNARVYAAQKPLWEQGADEEAARLEEVASIMRDYVIPLIPLVSEDITQVTHAFARVNRGGTPMSEAHLAAALAYGQLPIREGLQQLEEEFSEMGWTSIGQGELLNGLKLRHGLDVYRAPIPTLIGRLKAGDFNRELKLSRTGMNAAFSVLREAGVHGSLAMPYTYQALLLCEALVRLNAQHPVPGDMVTRGIRWFWQTTFCETFTGATGKRLRESLDSLAAYLQGDSDSPFEGSSATLLARHSRWGSVRTVARMLVIAKSTNSEVPLNWLGYEGGQAVHKPVRTLETTRIGSWIVADVTALKLTRASLARGDALPPESIAAQMVDGAWAALLADDVEEYAALQEVFVLDLERAKMSEVGLSPTTADT